MFVFINVLLKNCFRFLKKWIFINFLLKNGFHFLKNGWTDNFGPYTVRQSLKNSENKLSLFNFLFSNFELLQFLSNFLKIRIVYHLT